MRRLVEWVLITLFFGVTFLSASVWAQPGRPVEGLSSLAGTWRGYAINLVTGQASQPGAVTVYIKDDKTYEGHSGYGLVAGKITVDGGKLSFQSSRASGTVTLEEARGKQVLKFWFDNGKLAGEYDRVK